MKEFFRKHTNLTTFSNNLSKAENILDLVLIDHGRKVVACEYALRPGRIIDGYFLNIYDLENNGEKLQSLAINNEVSIYAGIALYKNPDQIALVIKEKEIQYLSVVSLSEMRAFAPLAEVPKIYFGPFPSSLSKFFSEPFIPIPFNIEFFDGGQRAILHDGQSSRMGHRLVSFDLGSGKLHCKPINTWDSMMDEIRGKALQRPSGAEEFGGGVENRAGIGLRSNRAYVTGTRMGQIQIWSIDDLSLRRRWQLNVPENMGDQQWPNCQIYSLASSRDERKLAAGTCGGSIHIFDSNDGSELTPPMIPDDVYFGDRTNLPSGKKEPSPVRFIAFYSNDVNLIAAYENGDVRTWNINTARQESDVISISRGFSDSDRLSITSDSKLFYFCHYENKYGFFDLKTQIQPLEESVKKESVAPNGSRSATKPINIFISYSHRDEELRLELNDHLGNLRRQGLIIDWHDRQIEPGQVWGDEIDKEIEAAQIILLLVSARFMASDYCYKKEMDRAMAKHAAKVAIVIPIILSPCDWQGAPFSKLQALPKDAKPITTWVNRDEAWTNVILGLRRAIQAF